MSKTSKKPTAAMVVEGCAFVNVTTSVLSEQQRTDAQKLAEFVGFTPIGTPINFFDLPAKERALWSVIPPLLPMNQVEKYLEPVIKYIALIEQNNLNTIVLVEGDYSAMAIVAKRFDRGTAMVVQSATQEVKELVRTSAKGNPVYKAVNVHAAFRIIN